jgi:transcriptional regulator GlxA family with amidase domain
MARYVGNVSLTPSVRHGESALEVVAGRCGLGTAESLRRVFHRNLGVSPDAYRRRFRTTTPAKGASA